MLNYPPWMFFVCLAIIDFNGFPNLADNDQHSHNRFWNTPLPGSKQKQSLGAWAWTSPSCKIWNSRFSVHQYSLNCLLNIFGTNILLTGWRAFFQPIFWFSSMTSSLYRSSREANISTSIGQVSRQQLTKTILLLLTAQLSCDSLFCWPRTNLSY